MIYSAGVIRVTDGETDEDMMTAILNHELEFFSPEFDDISQEAKVWRSLDTLSL